VRARARRQRAGLVRGARDDGALPRQHEHHAPVLRGAERGAAAGAGGGAGRRRAS
jgi:hypothetical protein